MKKLRKFVTLGDYYTSTTVEGVVYPHDFSPFCVIGGRSHPPPPSFLRGGRGHPQLFFFEPLHFPSRFGKQTMRASLQSGKATLTRPLLRFGFPGERAPSWGKR